MFEESGDKQSKCIEESSHYLGDEQDFGISSKCPSCGICQLELIPDKGPLLETSKSCLPLVSETIL